MDSEDETTPYLKLLNENAGNYLIQNSYELQDCLSVEPIFTEIETETWSSDCFPILLNGLLVNENSNIREATHNISEKVQEPTDTQNLSGHIIVSQHSNLENSLNSFSKAEDIPSFSNVVQNVISQESLLEINSKSVNSSNRVQFGKQKKTLLLVNNGNTYEISYSNDKSLGLIESKEFNRGSVVFDNINENTTGFTKQIIQVVSPDENDQEEKNQQENSSTSDQYLNDISDWNEFYGVISAMKCKVCSFLCENTEEMTDHLKRLHGDLIKLKQAAEKADNSGGQKFKMRSLLNTNTSTEKEIMIYLCSMCNNIFATEELLMDHVKIHKEKSRDTGCGKENELTTIQDDKHAQSVRNVATSSLVKQKKAMKKLKCSLKGCSLKFANNDSKLRHEECHMPNTNHFQCPECKEEFSVWRICSKHLWSCHKIDAGMYTCPICNQYKSNSPVVVMKHMDIHCPEKPFLCSDCGKGFKQLTQLRNHMFIHKKKEDLPPWLSSRKCTICDRFFANNKSLQKHIQCVHEKLKPYICNVCEYRTSRKAMLEMHIRQHTGDKPHHCHHCSYKTGDHNCLRKHIRKHYGLTQYSCPHCEYRAIQSSAYKYHLITKHPEAKEIFKCGYCSFTSLKYDLYLTHVKCHEYERDRGKEESQAVSKTSSRVGTKNYKFNYTQSSLHIQGHINNSEDIDCGGEITLPSVYEMEQKI